MHSQSETKLTNRILIGLALGLLAAIITLLAGKAVPGLLEFARNLATQVLDPFSQIFLRLLFFVVLPLVFCSLTSGMLHLGELRHLGPLAARTFTLFALNMSIAVLLGLLMMNTLQPGGQLDAGTQTRLMTEYGSATQGHISRHAEAPAMNLNTLVDMFMPRNLFGAFIGNSRSTLGDVLPLILFALLVGAAGLNLSESKRQRLHAGLDMVNELMTGIVHFALKLAPYAVPALIYSAVVKLGFDIVIALGLFVLGCMTMLLLHLFGTMSLWLKLWTLRSPLEFFNTIKPVIVTAFSTSSSSATLPAALTLARDRLHIRPSTAGFVLPLGTTMNMSGTALYEGCVVLFIAQVFGVDLGLLQQLTLLGLSVLSAVAVASIPGGSLPLIAGLLVSFNIPPEGIGIILGVDRLLDMTRTMVNVGCDLVTCAVVDGKDKPV
ncbi:MAG: dicarboxylate/amino acid:cation symporter [Steroidobacteraceae bacterium]